MKKYGAFLGLWLIFTGCSEEEPEATPGAQAGQSGAGQSGAGGSDAGSGGSSGEAGAGAGGEAGVGGSAGAAGSGTSGQGGAGASGGAGSSGSSGQAGSGSGEQCTEALKTVLGPVDKVSAGEVTVVKEENGAKLLFVDASAGGQQAAPENPRVYIELSGGKRVDLSDPQASGSDGWDLALKRAVLFTNGGQGGPGEGGAVFVEGKSFEEVSGADAKDLKTEAFVSEDCIPNLDPMNSVVTSFGEWYDYNPQTHQLSPKAGVYVVRGAKGALFKVEITGYYGKPDGTNTAMGGGRYLLRVAGL
ncbi:MAG: HmuY family protein [Polyangiaceae bacterium]|jgi:hypothetical protein|nr:HmuY family protein [Polyangiaceae bacterium]